MTDHPTIEQPAGQPAGLAGDVRPCASYTLRVNGFERPVTEAWIGESLLYVLRERLGLAGAKGGCEQGECGACSVQVDGQLVAGCLVPAALAADSEIATVEGLAESGGPSDVQRALAESGAVQCGYCTPGLAMAVHDLLQRNHRPSDVEARQALCGNLCRCTGYRGVLAAVQSVAEQREAELEAEAEAAEAAAQDAAAQDPGAPDTSARDAAGRLDDTLPGDTLPGVAPQRSGHLDDRQPPAQPVAQSVADLPLAGELPLYADSELWVEAEQFQPDQPTAAGTGVYSAAHPADGHHAAHQPPGYDPAGYGTGNHPVVPPQPTGHDTGHFRLPGYQGAPGYEATPAHGIAHDGPGPDTTPAHGTPYLPTPPHGTGHPGYPQGHQLPGHAPAHPAGGYDPAGYPGTGYDGSGYDAPVYDGPGYAAPGYDGPGYDGPGYDGPGYDGPVYETPGHETPGYDGSTPAHGIHPQPAPGVAPIPEDRHA